MTTMFNSIDEYEELRQELTRNISKKNQLIADMESKIKSKEEFFRNELKQLYNEINNLENQQKEEKVYTLRDVASEVNIGVKVFTKTLIDAGILVRKEKGSNVKIELADPYKHLNIDITEYGHEPTYNESSHIYYTEFGKQFLLNCYQREVKGSGTLF